jgi:hypothetical protein
MPEIHEIQQNDGSVEGVSTQKASADDFSSMPAVAQVGGAITKFGDAVQARNTQNEIATNNAAVSQLHADTVQSFKKYIARAGQPADAANGLPAGPDLNDPELIRNFMKDNYDSQIDALTDKTDTNGGQNYLNRASARTKMILQDQMIGQVAHYQGAALQNQVNASIGARSSTVLSDPTIFNQVNAEHVNFLNELQKANGSSAAGVDPAVFDKLREQGSAQLAKAAMEGYINADVNLPGDVDAQGNKTGPSLAKQKLDGDVFDTYFKNSDIKEMMYAKLTSKENANAAQQRQLELAQEKRDKVINGKDMTEMYTSMANGQLAPQTILDKMNRPNSPLPEHMGEHMMNLLKSDTKDPWNGNNDTYSKLLVKAMDPNDQTSSWEIASKYLNRNAEGINPTQMAHIKSAIDEKTASPESGHDWTAFTTLMTAQKQIYEGPNVGMKDPAGTERFIRDYPTAFKRFKDGLANDIPAGDLINRDSPNYVLRNINTRALSPMESGLNLMKAATGQGQSLNGTFKGAVDKIFGTGAPAAAAPTAPTTQPTSDIVKDSKGQVWHYKGSGDRAKPSSYEKAK